MRNRLLSLAQELDQHSPYKKKPGTNGLSLSKQNGNTRYASRQALAFTRPVNYSIPAPFHNLTQPSPRVCWAAVITMMFSWKNSAPAALDIGEVLRGINQRYLDMFRRDELLSGDIATDLYREAGLTAVHSFNPSIEGWEQFLMEFGPLYIDIGYGSRPVTHAVVVTGIRGDGTSSGTNITYSDPEQGISHTVPFSSFIRNYESPAAVNWPYTIVHWPRGARQTSSQQSYQSLAFDIMRNYSSAFTLNISDAGIRFISGFEGLRTNLYNDPVGHCTIGYGHLVHQGNCNGSEPQDLRNGITEQRALDMLREDAGRFATLINSSVTATLTQPQFDSLVSFSFNIGEGNFRSSTLLRVLNQGNYPQVPDELNRWVHASGRRLEGLVRRREREGRLFRDGVYS